jgi:hypothetical protein
VVSQQFAERKDAERKLADAEKRAELAESIISRAMDKGMTVEKAGKELDAEAALKKTPLSPTARQAAEKVQNALADIKTMGLTLTWFNKWYMTGETSCHAIFCRFADELLAALDDEAKAKPAAPTPPAPRVYRDNLGQYRVYGRMTEPEGYDKNGNSFRTAFKEGDPIIGTPLPPAECDEFLRTHPIAQPAKPEGDSHA